jgi:RNA polymerase sigma factor (sigma-70 family)
MKRIIFTDRSNDCAKKLLHDIRKSAPLKTDEEYQLWLQMRQGDQRAKDELVFSNLRYVVTIAKRYQASGAEFADLFLSGALGLTLAVDKFDASRGVRLLSFAVKYIESEIRKTAYDYIRHDHTSLDAPVDADDEHGATRIEFLADGCSQSPDWNIRYSDALDSLAERAEKRRSGAGHLVTALHQMLQKGYSTSDFARSYHLNDHQMSFLLNSIKPSPSTAPIAA